MHPGEGETDVPRRCTPVAFPRIPDLFFPRIRTEAANLFETLILVDTWLSSTPNQPVDRCCGHVKLLFVTLCGGRITMAAVRPSVDCDGRTLRRWDKKTDQRSTADDSGGHCCVNGTDKIKEDKSESPRAKLLPPEHSVFRSRLTSTVIRAIVVDDAMLKS